MSRNRLPSDAGYCDPAKLPKGPNGRALCRCGCGLEVTPPRRTFQSPECLERYRDTHLWPSDARSKLLARDHGICALCGFDCEAALSRMNNILQTLRYSPDIFGKAWAYGYSAPDARALAIPLVREYVDLAEKAGAKPNHRCTSLWHADHIVPVCEGGGECGIENYRTLCLRCHHTETAKLAKRRARARGESTKDKST